MDTITTVAAPTETQWPSGIDPEPFAQAAADAGYVKRMAGAFFERIGDEPYGDAAAELREVLEHEAYTRRQLPRLLQALKRRRIGFELGAGELTKGDSDAGNTLVAFQCPFDGGQVAAHVIAFGTASRLGWLWLTCDREEDVDGDHHERILAALDFQPLRERDSGERVDWDALWLDNVGAEQGPRWLIDGVMERGETATLFGQPGSRKSLLALYWALQLVRRGEDVLYLDRENPERHIYRRLVAMGATVAELARLDYRSFPDLLVDTEDGAAAIVRAAKGKALVVFDSWARFFASGSQSEDGPATQAYNNLLLPLRATGIAVLILDHTGVGDQKRPSGSIQKMAQVDQGWHLNTAGEASTLTHTKSRGGQGADLLALKWLSAPLRAETATPVARPATAPAEAARDDLAAQAADVQACIQALDDLSVPIEWGRRRALDALVKAGRPTYGNATVAEAVRVRKAVP